MEFSKLVFHVKSWRLLLEVLLNNIGIINSHKVQVKTKRGCPCLWNPSHIPWRIKSLKRFFLVDNLFSYQFGFVVDRNWPVMISWYITVNKVHNISWNILNYLNCKCICGWMWHNTIRGTNSFSTSFSSFPSEVHRPPGLHPVLSLAWKSSSLIAYFILYIQDLRASWTPLGALLRAPASHTADLVIRARIGASAQTWICLCRQI